MCCKMIAIFLLPLFVNDAFSTEKTDETQEVFKCSLPDVTAMDTELNISRFRTDFSKISEVKFPSIIGLFNERLICKIKCIDGNWVGPLCSTSEDGRFQPILRECSYRNDSPVLLVAFKNASIENDTNFPHGHAINVRCNPYGLYKLIGESVIQCENGEWSPKLPECVPTSMVTNFTGDAPPTIQYKVLSGSASVEPSGELVVFPDSIVQLDCISKRKNGNPEWSWTQMLGQHTAAWSEDLTENETHYRLILNKMDSRHSDKYTCTTPGGQTNTVFVKVVNVVCPSMNIVDGRFTYHEEGVRVGQSVHFNCDPGFNLVGNGVVTCMGSAHWSSDQPKCVQITCPTIKGMGAHVTLVEYNATYGGRAVFQCAWGYRLVGSPGIECEQNGQWSGELPSCIPIYCPNPITPPYGVILTKETTEKEKYPVGDLVTYACNEGYNLVGESSIVCTETGFWSHPPPFCMLADEKSKSDIIYYENTTLVSIDEIE